MIAPVTSSERRRLRALHVHERTAWEGGAQLVCGIDEAGRGPLAGPVTACAVVLTQPLVLEFLNDSKLVSPLRRAALAPQIRAAAAFVAVGWATSEEIDALNILVATRLAMARALEQLNVRPCQVLVDAVHIPQCDAPQTAIIGGDGKSAAIAAASIVAKVARDEYMETLDESHPGYGFRHNRGYATEEHLAALDRLGPCAAHRRSFAPVMQPSLFAYADGGNE
ncbi:MAG TPA: ribonuclease HII [Candidatus Eremiobacteraceae bacterium]|nr:ribonuclease HII [Candidatus Eremiobacteraceae bacterium]